jgi:thiol-disulfide isomerase/thioredoxin
MMPGARSRLAALATGLVLLAAVARAQTPAEPPQAPSKGDVIPAFETLGLDDKPVKVDFPKGSTTLLLFFLSSCPHCHKQIPEWNRAYERRSKSVKVMGVVLDQAPPEFWQTMPIAFPVLHSPGRAFLSSLHVNRVPLTLRVGTGGRVEDLAVGPVDPIRLGELFAPAR